MGSMMAGRVCDAERELLLGSLLREAGEAGVVVALEEVEWCVAAVHRAEPLLRDALDRGTRLIATCVPEQSGRFGLHPLGQKVEMVRLRELGRDDARVILDLLRPGLASHHRVEIDGDVEHAAVERSIPMNGLLCPARRCGCWTRRLRWPGSTAKREWS